MPPHRAPNTWSSKTPAGASNPPTQAAADDAPEHPGVARHSPTDTPSPRFATGRADDTGRHPPSAGVPASTTNTPRIGLLANALLLAMPLALVGSKLAAATYPQLNWLFGAITAFATAALVGGIADWFAVTALFRRPFGLPIPHTAIIPRSKDRIADGIAGFAAENFLSEEALGPRLRALRPSTHIANWLIADDHARRAGQFLATALAPLMQGAVGPAATHLFLQAAAEEIERFDVSPACATMVGAFIDGGHHRMVYDRLIDAAARFLSLRKDEVGERIAARGAWWIPSAVDRRIASQVEDGLDDVLVAMRTDDHPARQAFEDWLRGIQTALTTDPRMKARIAAAKSKALASPTTATAAHTAWTRISARIAAAAGDDDGVFATAAADMLRTLGERLTHDPAARAALDTWLRESLRGIIAQQGAAAAAAIAAIVRRWDPQTLAVKVERGVGRDLQFIRINGTLVGGLVGLVLHLLGG